MALAKGVNSYVTVAEADDYFSDRLDVAAWVSADAAQKSQALVTASGVLDAMTWIGTAISIDQPLSFPRNGSYFDPRLGQHTTIDGTTVPSRVVQATRELAHHLLNNDGILDDNGLVSDMQIGSINLSKIRAPNLIPANVKRLIKPLLLNSGSNSWFRSN